MAASTSALVPSGSVTSTPAPDAIQRAGRLDLPAAHGVRPGVDRSPRAARIAHRRPHELVVARERRRNPRTPRGHRIFRIAQLGAAADRYVA